jgi:hypothetical protein
MELKETGYKEAGHNGDIQVYTNELGERYYNAIDINDLIHKGWCGEICESLVKIYPLLNDVEYSVEKESKDKIIRPTELFVSEEGLKKVLQIFGIFQRGAENIKQLLRNPEKDYFL